MSSPLVIAVENKPGDGLPPKRLFYCKSILDFVETHVCSLVYRFAFSTDRVWRLHFASMIGFASRIGFQRSGTSVALWLHKDGQPRGVVLRPSQKMFEEMIGNRHYALTLEFFQDKFTDLGLIQTTEAQINTSLFSVANEQSHRTE